MPHYSVYSLEKAIHEAFPKAEVMKRGQVDVLFRLDGKEFRAVTVPDAYESVYGGMTSGSDGARAVRAKLKDLLPKYGLPDAMKVDFTRRVVMESRLPDGTVIVAELRGGGGKAYDVDITLPNGFMKRFAVDMHDYQDALDPYVLSLLDELRDTVPAEFWSAAPKR